MELANNFFNDGMNLDTHPMVQSSKTLSNALNATFVTMNGNEVILQNDMGNRRVDNAYLPAGYEPVGIKEHGGIIYVAAYNPITHRSLIGSFPSPERNMGEEYTDNGTYFEFTKFIEESNIITKNGVKFLKNDVILLPLTKDTALHAGDRFTVYSDYIWLNSNIITNFGVGKDENEQLVIKKYSKTPSNNYFTLSLGILNSLNEFSDITPTLLRFGIDGKVLENLESEDEKFNSGYFIAPEETWKAANGITENDFSLIKERNKKGTNTYAYKLTGPLFLKVELNHILTFSYELETSREEIKDENNNTKIKVNIFITGTATYNCPDDKEENIDYLNSFDFLVKNSNGIYTKKSEVYFTKSSRIYNQSSGQYTSTITKLYVILKNSENSFIDYAIAVPIFSGNPLNANENYYLDNLSEFGTLDVSKIGTNLCELVMWKYKNLVSNGEIKSTLIDYKFDCYPDPNTTFTNFSIELENLTETSGTPLNLGEIIEINTEVDGGRKQLLIDWTLVSNESKKLKVLNLYLAKLKFTKKIKDSNSNDITVYRFILGTELFNKCFDESNDDDYTSDFGIFMGTEANDRYEYKYSDNSKPQIIEGDSYLTEIRNKYLKLNDKIDAKDTPTIQNVITSLNNNSVIKAIYDLDSTPPSFLLLSFIDNISVNYGTSSVIIDNNLYPENLVLSNVSLETSVEMEKEVSSNLIKEGDYNKTEDEFNEEIVGENFENENYNNNLGRYSCTLNFFDKIYLGWNKETRIIGKAYVNLNSNTFHQDIINIISKNLKYSGFRSYIDWSNTDRQGYEGWLNGYNIYNSGEYHYGICHYDLISTLWLEMFGYNKWHKEGELSSSFGDSLIDSFRTILCPFTFMLFDNNTYYYDHDTEITRNGDWFYANSTYYQFLYPASEYTRVWWIDEDGKPVLLNKNRDNTVSGIISAKNPSGGETSDAEKERNIYNNILKFIGTARIKGSTIDHPLVIPLDSFPYLGLYPNPYTYLYSDHSEINLTAKINYIFKTNNIIEDVVYYNNNNENNKKCLNFYTKNLEHTLSKKITKKIVINNNFSQNIYNLSQQNNLSNYSIDLEKGVILSSNEPIKHLYIRKGDSTILKDVPSNFPILVNPGTKYEFPIVCKKEYSSSLGNIGHNCMAFPFAEDTALGCLTILLPWTEKIPLLNQEDLTITDKNFFNS